MYSILLMEDKDLNLYYFSYCLLLSLFIIFLFEWLLLQNREKLKNLKRTTSIHFKLFQYKKIGKFFIFCCFLYTLYFIRYKAKSYTYYELLGIPAVLSSVFEAYKQIFGYSKAEINAVLKDNEGIGAFWAHQTYDAYYKIILESIKDRMSSFEKDFNIQIKCKKLLIIIPLSCNVECTLNDKDDRIQYFGEIELIEIDQAANMNRQYRNPVYRISSTEDIYIVAEFPTAVRVLWERRCNIQKEKFLYIRDSFIKTLKFLLQGSPCIVIQYNDVVNCPETLSSCILSTIIKESSDFI